MPPSSYLPSTQFVITLTSIVVASTLIYGARAYTSPQKSTAELQSAAQTGGNDDWQATLNQIQEESAFAALPEPLSAETVASFLEEAQSSNLTESIGRSLLVNLSNAKSQGLGDDIPTQEQIINYATASFGPPVAQKTYTSADIILAPDTTEAKRVYGNAVMEVVRKHPGASASETLTAMARATDNNNASELESFTYIQNEYEAIIEELAGIAVPQTLVPLHVQMLNGLGKLSLSFDDMRAVLTDPLRGLQGLQHYQLMLGEVGRIFTTVAEMFNREAILFTKDEPGHAWSLLLAAQ